MKHVVVKIKKYLFKVFVFTCLCIPSFVFAQIAATPEITNPLQADSIPALIVILVGAAKDIGYFLIVLFIIYSGYLFVEARGDEKKVGTAKETFKWTVVGAAVLLGADILAQVVQGTITQLG